MLFVSSLEHVLARCVEHRVLHDCCTKFTHLPQSCREVATAALPHVTLLARLRLRALRRLRRHALPKLRAPALANLRLQALPMLWLHALPKLRALALHALAVPQRQMMAMAPLSGYSAA